MSKLFSKILQNLSTRIIFIIYLLIIFTTGFFLTYGYYTNLTLQEQRQFDKLKAIVISIGNNINGDLHEELTTQLTKKDAITSVNENEIYNQIHKILNTAVVENKLNSSIYTLLLDTTKHQFYYIVRSDDKVYYKHSYIQPPKTLMENYEIGGVLPKYVSENGTWLSAFYPIKNKQGTVVALLEADIAFDEFSDIVTAQFKTQLFISVGVILLIALIFIPFTQQILTEDHKQKLLFMKQNKIITEKNKDIIDSINYALKIQKSILPSTTKISKAFKNHFVLFKPKDIVSGDFYWLFETDQYIFLAVADATGHGVPGSMVSIVCANAINRAVIQLKITETNLILDEVNNYVIDSFKDGMKDGMDISFCRINKENNKLQYSGANNSVIIISEGVIKELSPTRQPIGHYIKNIPFKKEEFSLKTGDLLYLSTDGFYDQFGGVNNKKMKLKPFKNLLLQNSNKEMEIQKDIFENFLEKWKGENEQVDDITVLGIKI